MAEGGNINPVAFQGTAVENPEIWLRHFLNYCHFKEFNEVKTMDLFKLLLSGSAATWLESLSGDSLASWNNLREAFLTRYTTPAFMKLSLIHI